MGKFGVFEILWIKLKLLKYNEYIKTLSFFICLDKEKVESTLSKSVDYNNPQL